MNFRIKNTDRKGVMMANNNNNTNKPFVMYITEHLLKKVTNQDNLKLVTSLVLPFSKDKNEKIRVCVLFEIFIILLICLIN